MRLIPLIRPAVSEPGGARPDLKVTVRVTFLRMDKPPEQPVRPLPADVTMVRVAAPTVAFYRYLYNTVGEAHLWWLRRVAEDAEIAAVLADAGVSLHVLYRGGAPGGFYELDRRNRPHANISYFGLLPHELGRGLGTAFLRHAIDAAWRDGTRAVTVNTCTADNPRALPGYVRAGFRPVRETNEAWSIPARLGLVVPDHLRG